MAEIKYRYLKGQVKMALWSELSRKVQNVPTNVLMDIAMECVDAGRCTAKWRKQLGKELADAITIDLRDMMI